MTPSQNNMGSFSDGFRDQSHERQVPNAASVWGVLRKELRYEPPVG
jgi:hypothetical protein